MKFLRLAVLAALIWSCGVDGRNARCSWYGTERHNFKTCYLGPNPGWARTQRELRGSHEKHGADRLCVSAISGSTPVRTINSLAPRPLFFRDPESIEEWVKQYYELRVFIEKIHPGADVLVTRIENPPTDPHWFKLPFLWKGMSVWVKMHHIYDQRRGA